MHLRRMIGGAACGLSLAGPTAAQVVARPEQVPPAQATAEAREVLEQALQDSSVSVIRNSLQIEPFGTPNRELVLATRPRASAVAGVCQGEVMELVATREPAAGKSPYGPGAAVVRRIEVTHLFKVPPPIPEYKPINPVEAEARCTRLDQPSQFSYSGWFPAPDPGAARTAGQVAERLAADYAKGPRHGLLAGCRPGKCPDAEAAPLLFRPEAVASVNAAEKDCPQERFCYTMQLVTYRASPAQGWTVDFETRGGLELQITRLSLKRTIWVEFD